MAVERPPAWATEAGAGEARPLQRFLGREQRLACLARVERRGKARAWARQLGKQTLPAGRRRHVMPPRDALAARAFTLANNGEEAKASRLKKAFASLDLEANPDVSLVVQLLVCLQDAGPREAPSGREDCTARAARPPGQAYTTFPGQVFEARPAAAGPRALTLLHPAAFLLPGPGGGEGADEGYVSPTVPEEDDGDDIWSVVLAAGPAPGPSRRAWSRPGQPAPPAPPLLSEAGPGAALHLWALAAASLRLIDPSYHPAPPRLVTREELGRHLGFLAAGIPSRSFPLRQGSSAFTIAPGLCLSTLTPETLESFASSFLSAGSLTRHLEALCCSTPPTGSIWGGFQAGLRSFLRLYVASVIKLAERIGGNLGTLELALRPLHAQVTFLGRLCFRPGASALPAGVSLLDRLLEVSVHVSNTMVHLLLVSLLKAAAAPYFRFLQNWLFSGESDPEHREFGLAVDPRFLSASDRSYWQHSFALLPVEGSTFLQDIQAEVHRVGKSVALLRRLCPDHFLAGRFRHLQPRVSLAVSGPALAQLKAACAEYSASLAAVAAQETVSLAERAAREEGRLSMARRRLAERNREAREDRCRAAAVAREEKVERQKGFREALARQVEEVRERREREAAALAEEAQLIEAAAERMAEEAERREAEDRARVEQFYARRSAEAEQRERRAEWRLARGEPGLRARRAAVIREQEEAERLPAGAGKVAEADEMLDNTLDDSVFPAVKVQTDSLGNMTVTVEDGEGNLVTEPLEQLGDLTEDIRAELRRDNFRALGPAAKALVCASLASSRDCSLLEAASTAGSARRQTRLAALTGSLGRHLAEEAACSTPLLAREGADREADEVEAGRRKGSGSVPIERLLYPARYRPEERPDRFQPTKTEFVLCSGPRALPYTRAFPAIGDQVLRQMGGPDPATQPAAGPALAPLALVLQTSILAPLRAQARLADSALLTHLLVDCRVSDHLAALRNFLFLADGEFGRQLVVSLCQLGGAIHRPGEVAGRLHSYLAGGGPCPPRLLSPAALNRVLDSALQGASRPLACHLSFQLEPAGRETPGRGLGIPGLSLTYLAG